MLIKAFIPFITLILFVKHPLYPHTCCTISMLLVLLVPVVHPLYLLYTPCTTSLTPYTSCTTPCANFTFHRLQYIILFLSLKYLIFHEKPFLFLTLSCSSSYPLIPLITLSYPFLPFLPVYHLLYLSHLPSYPFPFIWISQDNYLFPHPILISILSFSC